MTWLTDGAVSRLQAVATWPEFTTDRYTIVDEIGRGGMGTVYLARDEALGREVAIKVSNAIASEALEHRLQTEAHVLARLEHPGIVPIHDVGRLADGRLFYVMKRVLGETLRERVRAQPSVTDALRIVERVCEPVAFAHAHGCIHRDLKPENVMIGAFGEVMVMDWGVARLRGATEPAPRLAGLFVAGHSPRTDAGTVLGTPGYMPPEQAQGGALDADERADVYALGALLLALITGDHPPIDPHDVAGVIARAALPRPLRAICIRALAPVPADRYRSVQALSVDIGRYLDGQAVDAHRESIVERTARIGRTYRTPILLVLAYMVMRVVVALF